MKSSAFLFIVMLLVVLSCNNENVTVNSSKTDRILFNDLEAFNQTYLSLSKMSSREELEQWARDKNHSTLLNTDDPNMENYSDMLKTILNKDYEFQVGDHVIWFNNGNLYSFSKNQVPNLNELKKNPENCTKYGNVKSTAIGTIDSDPNGRTNDTGVNFNNLDARNQKQFTQQYYQQCGTSLRSLSGTRKYVHEMYDETFAVSPGPVYYSYLYLRIKLEYKGSSWRAAGEQRETTVGVSGWVQVVGSGLGVYNYSINTSNNCYSGNWYILVASANHGPYYSQPPYWVVSMRGSIYHRVKGDLSSNAWTNTEWKAGYGYLW